MSRVSVVINTRNEEKNLPRAIASVKKLADEVVVCDMESTDDTLAVAKKLGAKTVTHAYVGYVEPARNFAISKATNEWILILDADEVLPPSLSHTLASIAKDPGADFYRIPRKNIVFGKWLKHSRWWPDHNIRFFKKGAVTWNDVIHTVPDTKGKGLDLPAEEEMAIIHHNYESIDQYLVRMNRYTTIQADLKIKSGYKFAWADLVTKPWSELFSRYFAGSGFKDGLHGIVMAILQAVSEFIIYLKVWEKEGFEDVPVTLREVLRRTHEVEKDLNYWKADALLSDSPSVLLRVKRKFKLP